MTHRPTLTRQGSAYVIQAGAYSWTCANDRAALREYNRLLALWCRDYMPAR